MLVHGHVAIVRSALFAGMLAVNLAACQRTLSNQPATRDEADWVARAVRFRATFSAWVGCYEVDAGAWTGDTSRSAPKRFAVPHLIRLDIERSGSYMQLRPLPDTGSGYSTAGWRASGPNPKADSLFLIWQAEPGALFGPALIARLARTANSYRGMLQPSTDIRGSDLPYRPVTATRTDCGTQVEPPPSDER